MIIDTAQGDAEGLVLAAARSQSNSPKSSRTPKRGRANSLPELGANCVKGEVEIVLQNLGAAESIRTTQANMQVLERAQFDTMQTANNLVAELSRVLQQVDGRIYRQNDASSATNANVTQLQSGIDRR